MVGDRLLDAPERVVMANWPPLPGEREGLQRTMDARVIRVGDDSCWLFTGKRDGSGYGVVRRRAGESRREYRTHRLALWLSGVEFDRDQFVLHACDNRVCCNPAHLRVGTHAENASDRSERQRHGNFKGTRNPAARLNEQQVREIRSLLRAGESQTRIARQFSIAQTTVSAIARGAVWNHLDSAAGCTDHDHSC